MARQFKSVLGGAFVAALLILPAAAGDSDWTTGGWQSFDVRAVKLDTLVGRLTVDVKPQAKVGLQISGAKDRIDQMSIRVVDGTLRVDGGDHNSVWDWRTWLDFSDVHNDRSKLVVHLVVPKGTTLGVDDMVGDANIGDIDADLHFEAAASHATIGRVRDAHISLAGAGKVDMADINGNLHLEIAGAGVVRAKSVHDVHAEIAGSGTSVLGPINGGLHLEIAGSGNMTAARVNGPVHVSITGSGSVRIPEGRADPLHIDIMGAGNFTFGGVAVDPHISAVGSGNVTLRGYTGNMHNDGMASVRVGSEGFPPAPPAPPRPPSPPAPPAPPRN